MKKRLFSSPAAFATTLTQHERSLTGERADPRRSSRPTLAVLRRHLDQGEEEFADEEQYEAATEDSLAAAALALRSPSRRRRQRLHVAGRQQQPHR